MARSRQQDGKTKAAASDAQAVHGTALLGKALDIVEFVADSDRRLKFRDIADHTGHTRSTLYRILSALTARDVLAIDSRDQAYILGPKFTAMAGSINQSSDLIACAGSPLRELSDVYGENINLAVLNGSAPVVVARWQGWGGMPFASPLGERKPLHATSLGKAFLAFSGSRGADLMQHVNYTRYTDRTLTVPADLEADLSISRIRGFTQDDNEIIEGIVCVAVPIRTPDGQIAACVSFNAPSHRMALARRSELASALQVVATRISDDLAMRLGGPAGTKGPSERVRPVQPRGFETRVSHYDGATGSLFWFDIAGGTINRHNPEGCSILASLGRPVQALCPGTRGELWAISDGSLFAVDASDGAVVGEIIKHPLLQGVISAQSVEGGFILTTDTGLWCFSSCGEVAPLFEATAHLCCSRFNSHGMAAAVQAEGDAVTILRLNRNTNGCTCSAEAKIRLDREAPHVTTIDLADDGALILGQENGWALWRYGADGKVVNSCPIPVPTVRAVTPGEGSGVYYCGSDRLAASANLLRLAPLSGAVFRVDFS